MSCNILANKNKRESQRETEGERLAVCKGLRNEEYWGFDVQINHYGKLRFGDGKER